MVPAAPLRKKFHSVPEIWLAVFMISPHSKKLNTSLSFSNRPLRSTTRGHNCTTFQHPDSTLAVREWGWRWGRGHCRSRVSTPQRRRCPENSVFRFPFTIDSFLSIFLCTLTHTYQNNTHKKAEHTHTHTHIKNNNNMLLTRENISI